MNVEQARFNMIEQQIRPWDVLDTSVLSLLSVVRREEFVPAGHEALAFMDMEIPLPDGGFMLSPKLEARLVQELNLSKRDSVLQIGAGSGYITALLAHKARRVIALESKPELATLARTNLRKALISNAEVVQSPAAEGLPAQGPYDAILLTGSVTAIPVALLEQLKSGGRLLAIIGRQPIMQATLVTKNRDGHTLRQALFDTVAPPLDGLTSPLPFAF